MPIDGDVLLDANTQHFSQQADTIVGRGGPTPQEVTLISTGDGPASGLPSMLVEQGGPTATGTRMNSGGASGKNRGQQAKENWIPPVSNAAPVKVGFDPDYTTDNNYVR